MIPQASRRTWGPATHRSLRPEQVAAAIRGLVKTGAERADLVPGQLGGSFEG